MYVVKESIRCYKKTASFKLLFHIKRVDRAGCSIRQRVLVYIRKLPRRLCEIFKASPVIDLIWMYRGGWLAAPVFWQYDSVSDQVRLKSGYLGKLDAVVTLELLLIV